LGRGPRVIRYQRETGERGYGERREGLRRSRWVAGKPGAAWRFGEAGPRRGAHAAPKGEGSTAKQGYPVETKRLGEIDVRKFLRRGVVLRESSLVAADADALEIDLCARRGGAHRTVMRPPAGRFFWNETH
jgi:hypothetical protein